MKTSAVIIIIIISIVLGVFVGKQCSEPINNPDTAIWEAEKKKLVEEGKIYSAEIIRQRSVINSLKDKLLLTDTLIVIHQAEVDSAIAVDSSNAFTEYRKGLLMLDIKPDVSFNLSVREAGLGALIFRETHGLRLKVIGLNDIVSNQDILINQQDNLIESKNNIAVLDSLTICGLEQTLKTSKPKWWQSPTAIIIYMLLTFAGGIAVAL